MSVVVDAAGRSWAAREPVVGGDVRLRGMAGRPARLGVGRGRRRSGRPGRAGAAAGARARVLDVPCGTGRVASRLAVRGYDVTGVDFTERFLEEGRARGDGVRYERVDMRELPFEEEFDAAICFWGSFGYFDEDGQPRAGPRGGPRAEARRALPDRHARTRDDPFEVHRARLVRGRGLGGAPGALVRPGRGSRRDRVDVPSGGRAARVPPHSMRIYTLHELTELLRGAGFTGFEARDDDLEPFASGSRPAVAGGDAVAAPLARQVAAEERRRAPRRTAAR